MSISKLLELLSFGNIVGTAVLVFVLQSFVTILRYLWLGAELYLITRLFES